uniref:FAM65 N-terminal domain-containing protein n=1 Tax=Knipowitschia caucasica TaxID=637954 RepID=A0AAV2M4J3_KNICA
MSVKLRFDSSSDGGPVSRTRSFTGLGSLTGRRRSASVRNCLRSKAGSETASPRIPLSPSKVGRVMWSTQPEQVDRVFLALRKGLKEYLEGHQVEMDFLSSQQQETKRNSRLAFLYDLQKEIRVLERYIRRLEFQISKVEELYETYCIQWRLCQGAVNMRRAFTFSPSSRATRESLLELNRNHRHSLQDMLSMEAELEILLGELQIKMKGLIGFARLCPGDQYEVVVRLGRQRWRIRGKIESDDTQTWDQEEMAFLPHMNHNFHIKVTEAKGLSWQLVGNVTCASADFFVSRPRLMLVDITELGTIKLQLEVSWNPFDSSEKMRPLSISRQSVSSRKSSMSWTARNTPSFTEKYFMSMVRDLQDAEGSLPSLVPKLRPTRGGESLLSYLSHQSQASIPSGHRPHSSSTPILTRTHSFPSSPSAGTSLGESRSQLSLDRGPVRESPVSSQRSEVTTPDPSTSGSLLVLDRSSTPDILRKSTVGEAECVSPLTSQVSADAESFSLPQPPQSKALTLTDTDKAVSAVQRRALSHRVGALITHLEESLQNNTENRKSEKELKALDHHLLHLATILKNDLSLMRSACSEDTLAVEEVLGSFDFLSNDLNANDDSTSCVGSIRHKDSGISLFKESPLRSMGVSPSASQEELGAVPLTSGNWSLDQAMEIHLDICCSLLQVLQLTDSAPSRQDLLDEVSLQTEALDKISSLLLQKNDQISMKDILPKAQRTRDLLQFWDDCADDATSAPFCCHVNSFSRCLRKRYMHKVNAKQPGQSERVFDQLLQQVGSVCRAVPSPWLLTSKHRLTLFQLTLYMQRWGVTDLGEHISQLSKEECILWSLRGPKRRKALSRLKQRHLRELLPLRQTLHTLGSLLTDPHHKVCKAAGSCLSRFASNKSFRSKVCRHSRALFMLSLKMY